MTDLSRIAPNGDGETPTTHAVLTRSNYNANKNQIQRHIKPETMKKLLRVTLA
jgi:hypothetical protein